MLEYFAHYVLTLRNAFLAIGVVLLVGGGVVSLGDTRGHQFGAILVQMAVVSMLGAIACAIGELREKK